MVTSHETFEGFVHRQQEMDTLMWERPINTMMWERHD